MKTVTLKPCLLLYRLKQAKEEEVVRSQVLICQAHVQELKTTETGTAKAVQSVIQESQNWSSLVRQAARNVSYLNFWSLGRVEKHVL